MLKVKQAAPITMGILAAATGVTCTTLGHYVDAWVIGYVAAGGFALFVSLATSLAGE